MATQIQELITELDKYLDDNEYYLSLDNIDDINSQVFEAWNDKFVDAMVSDLSAVFSDVEIGVSSSEFNIESDDDRGACVFYHKVALTDSLNSECLYMAVKAIINLNKIIVYLDSRYATVDKWKGQSKILTTVFLRLKAADKHPGYFSPISWQDLLNDTK